MNTGWTGAGGWAGGDAVITTDTRSGVVVGPDVVGLAVVIGLAVVVVVVGLIVVVVVTMSGNTGPGGCWFHLRHLTCIVL